MLQTVWNINTPDGHYVGQYTAASPDVAFSHYLTVSGYRDVEQAKKSLKAQPKDDDSHRIIFDDKEFILKPQQ